MLLLVCLFLNGDKVGKYSLIGLKIWNFDFFGDLETVILKAFDLPATLSTSFVSASSTTGAGCSTDCISSTALCSTTATSIFVCSTGATTCGPFSTDGLATRGLGFSSDITEELADFNTGGGGGAGFFLRPETESCHFSYCLMKSK